MPIEEKILAELKLAYARSLQQLYASEHALNESRKVHQAQAIFLPFWEKSLLPRARRYKKNPIRFCERVLGLGPDWFTVPEGITTYQVREMLKMAPEMTSMITEPVDMSKLDGKMILKRLQTLAAKTPGRKSNPEFERAVELRRAGKSIHQICLKNPAYKQMSPDARRSERERVRNGIKRCARKAKNKSQG